MRRSHEWSAVASLILIGLLVASVGASARAVTPRSTGRHCVMELTPAGTAGTQRSVTTHLGCYATFARAIAKATGGAVRLAADATPATVTAAALTPSTTASTTIIGIDYVDINYGGSSLTWEVSNGVGCSTGLTYSSTLTGAWNNVISSSKAFAGCTLNTHYDLTPPNQNNGAFINCTPNCSTMGAMNDATSYESWRP